MTVVLLKKGNDEWQIFCPDMEEKDARKWALEHANGTDEGPLSKVPSNGLTKDEVKARVLQAQTGADLGLDPHEDWEIIDILDDEEFSNNPDRLAEVTSDGE